MKIWILVIFLVVLSGYFFVSFSLKLSTSKKLAAATEKFEISGTDLSVPVLVLGDSTAFGVGASTPEESLPGRLAKEMEATYVENHSFSGARAADLVTQIAEASLRSYDTILIQIGGNDIIQFHSAEEAKRELGEALHRLPERRRVILLTAGNVGAATLFPFFLKPFYTRLNLAYHKEFAEVSKKNGAVYINLYTPRHEDPFVQEPKRYLSEDGLHPSSEGYRIWFERVVQVLERDS